MIFPGWLTLILIGSALLIADYYFRRQDAPPHPIWLHWVLGLLGALALVGGSFTDPTPPSSNDAGGYSWRWLLNAALVAISILSVVGNVVSAMGSASWLGISEIAWHWVLLAFATATALNAAFNRTPPVTAPPTAKRLEIERQVHAIRTAA
jgi:hypothetical protein